MRDGISISRAGHPVVVFVHDNFERAARAQAEGLRASGLRIFVYPQYTPGADLAKESEKAIIASDDFVKLLTR